MGSLKHKASAFTSDSTIPSPITGFKTFNNQVAGHLELENKPCFLVDGEDHVLKMVDLSRPTGLTELDFFERVFNKTGKDKDLEALRSFLPDYFGLHQINLQGEKLYYIKLENLLAGFSKPSIMDIKIGRCTSDPFADISKTSKQAIKYKYQMQLGFRILGYKSFRLQTEKTEFCDKNACISLTPEEILPTLAHFLDLSNAPERIYIVNNVINKLKRFLEWFSHQKLVNFYSSSILIAFDGERRKISSYKLNHKKDSTKLCLQQRNDVVVRMIDFPHTYFDIDNESLDINYIYGLKNLIGVFERLREEFCNIELIG